MRESIVTANDSLGDETSDNLLNWKSEVVWTTLDKLSADRFGVISGALVTTLSTRLLFKSKRASTAQELKGSSSCLADDSSSSVVDCKGLNDHNFVWSFLANECAASARERQPRANSEPSEQAAPLSPPGEETVSRFMINQTHWCWAFLSFVAVPLPFFLTQSTILQKESWDFGCVGRIHTKRLLQTSVTTWISWKTQESEKLLSISSCMYVLPLRQSLRKTARPRFLLQRLKGRGQRESTVRFERWWRSLSPFSTLQPSRKNNLINLMRNCCKGSIIGNYFLELRLIMYRWTHSTKNLFCTKGTQQWFSRICGEKSKVKHSRWILDKLAYDYVSKWPTFAGVLKIKEQSLQLGQAPKVQPAVLVNAHAYPQPWKTIWRSLSISSPIIGL